MSQKTQTSGFCRIIACCGLVWPGGWFVSIPPRSRLGTSPPTSGICSPTGDFIIKRFCNFPFFFDPNQCAVATIYMQKKDPDSPVDLPLLIIWFKFLNFGRHFKGFCNQESNLGVKLEAILGVLGQRLLHTRPLKGNL